MYAIDSFNKQQQLKGKINKLVAEIINPEHSFWRRQWDSIGGPLCKGILSSVDRIRGSASMGIRRIGTLNGIYQITFIIDNVYEQLLKKLSQINQETLSMNQILHQYCEVKKEDADGIVSFLQKQSIIGLNKELDDENFSEKLSRANFSGLGTYKDKVVNFLTSLHTNMLSVEFNDFSEIMKLIANMITEQIFRITESQLISPWSSYGMGELTKAISERVQHQFIVDEKQNSDSQNRENQENGGSKYNTIAKQIQYNARDYTIAYSQCEIIHYSQQKDRTNHHGRIDEKIKEYAENIRKDQPASMFDMIALANENGLDIKLVDDLNYQPTEEDKAKGTDIVVYTKGQIDNQGNYSIGHFQLMSKDGTIIDVRSNNNNCGYAVIQKILNDQGIDKSVEGLRNDRAQTIENNPRQFSKALRAQHWIETRYPQEANSLLIVGGATRPRPRPSFEELFNSGDYPNVGKYGYLDWKLRGRKGVLEINHIPPKAAYKDTPYEDITEYSMPSIAMFIKDHQEATSTGFGKYAQRHHAEINAFMRDGNVYAALKLDLKDILKFGSERRTYENQIYKFIDYVASTEVSNAPRNINGTRTLVTIAEAVRLKQDLFGPGNFQ